MYLYIPYESYIYFYNIQKLVFLVEAQGVLCKVSK
jgi:hypothetical protein